MPLIASKKLNMNFNTLRIDFKTLAGEALSHSHVIINELLPTGKMSGSEWIALNPLRKDKKLGSFSVNLTTGKWADFATGDGGGDLISLAAYLRRTSQMEAALWLQGFFRIGGSR